MPIHKYVYALGLRVRNNKILSCYDLLKQSEKWSEQELKSHQTARLRELVASAYRESPFYREKFAAAGVTPEEIVTLSDLSRIPVTTKDEVLAHASAIQSTAPGEKLYFSETSGSTGRPLVFYRNQEWDAWHNASVLRGYSWHGVEPWERNGYLWGYNIAPGKRVKVKLLDLLQNRFRLFSYKEEEIDRFMKKLEQASYLGGYSSMVYEIARKVNEHGLSDRFRLKMVKGTSEKIYDAYRTEVEKAFGRRLVSEYGSAEAGIIGFECAHGSMHVNMETVIVEVVDDEIVVTNLVSRSFPIIRYKLGDYLKLGASGPCPCGMAHPVIEEITGRVGGVIYGKKNSYPSLTLYYVFKNLASVQGIVLNYQAVQNAKGELELYIESLLGGKERRNLELEIEKYFSDDLEVRIVDGHKREDYTRKKKDFISNVGTPS